MVNLFSVTTNGVPRLSGPAWSVTVAATVAGAFLGRQLTSRVAEEWVRRLNFALALTGGLSVLVKGKQEML